MDQLDNVIDHSSLNNL